MLQKTVLLLSIVGAATAYDNLVFTQKNTKCTTYGYDLGLKFDDGCEAVTEMPFSSLIAVPDPAACQPSGWVTVVCSADGTEATITTNLAESYDIIIKGGGGNTAGGTLYTGVEGEVTLGNGFPGPQGQAQQISHIEFCYHCPEAESAPLVPDGTAPMTQICQDDGDGTYSMAEIEAAAAGDSLKPGDKVTIDGVEYTLTGSCGLLKVEPPVEVCTDDDADGVYTMEEIEAAAAGSALKPGDEVTIDGTTYTLSSTCGLIAPVAVCQDDGDGTYTMAEIQAAAAEGALTPGDKVTIDGVTYTLNRSCDLVPDEVADKVLAPPSKGSGSGDPHFKTWTGDKYDYHGECDLVLVDNPTFMDGLGLRVHIRTTAVKYFSYIEKVAVQIGEDVLEFDNDVENFYLNGALAETNAKHHKTLLGGFVVRRDPKALSIRLHDNGSQDRHAGLVAKIDLHMRKNGFPAVIVDGGHTDVFKGSLGLLGDWETGKRLARDGVTELNGEDATDFALEWQVRDTDPMLFKDARFPQFPQTCTPPAPRSTRLGSSNFEKEAEAACAHWKEDIEDCIFDVIATRDVLVAEEGHIAHLS